MRLFLFVRSRSRQGGSVGDLQDLDVEAMDELMPRMREAVDKATDAVHAAIVEAYERGEGPKERLGDLKRSVKRGKVGKAKRFARATVFTRNHYASIHEYGGRVGVRQLTRIPARPVWRPVLERIASEVDRIFEDL
jgi:phage gpG-like protein